MGVEVSHEDDVVIGVLTDVSDFVVEIGGQERNDLVGFAIVVDVEYS